MTKKSPLHPSTKVSSQGFALPIALGFGLLALLVGITAVLRSQDDRVISINKQDASKSQLAAEAGIVNIQNFLNRYRALARFDACSADDWDANGVCLNTGSALTDRSWGNPELIPNLNAVCGTGTLAESREAVIAQTSNDWQPVDSSDISRGEYRLVSYGNNGTLSVEGIFNRGEPSESRSILNATLPIFEIDNEQIAGLWVKTSVTGDPSIQSDIVGPCTGTLTATPLDNHAIIRTQLTQPSAPSLETSGSTVFNLAKTSDIPADVSSGVRELPLASDTAGSPAFYQYNIDSVDASFSIKAGTSVYPYYKLANISTVPNQKLPRLKVNGASEDDIPDSTGVYNYILASLDASLEFVPGAAVNIWITSSTIDLSNRRILNPCGAAGAAADCGPFAIRIYGTGAAGSTLTLNSGTSVCDTFFHLSNYDVTFSAGGSATGTCDGNGSKNTGVFWVNSWTGGDGSNSIVTPRETWSGALTTNLGLELPPPRIGPIQVLEPEAS